MNSGTQDVPQYGARQSGYRGLVQFGAFELNMQTGELRKNGVRIRLQGKPFQILQALLEHPGEVVTRDELRKRLWPADTFVDFESGLNTAANRLRLTLGDSAESPRYIQTLARTGYRFIAAVSEAEARPALEIVVPETLAPPPIKVIPVEAPKRRNHLYWGAGLVLLGILLAPVMYLTRAKPTPPAFRQITFRRGFVDMARFGPDGQTVLYGGRWNGEPASVSMVSPGSPESRSLGFQGYNLLSLSKSGELLLWKKRSIFRVPLNSGDPKLILDNVLWGEWTAQGDVAVVRQESGATRVELPRGKPVFQSGGLVSHLRVSPKGDAIAFLDHPVSGDDGGNVVWVDASGNAHRVSEGWASLEGMAWTPDGNEIWFTASRTGVNRALYAVRRDGVARTIASIPGTMTLQDVSPQGQVLLSRDTLRMAMSQGSGESDKEKDLSWFDWSQPEDISPDGKYLLFTESGEGGGRDYAAYLRDLSSGATVKLSNGQGFAFFPDGKSVITMLPRENTHLNVVPIGAGQARSISGTGGFTYQWTQVFPDGKKLLVSGNMPGRGRRLYTQPADGGALTPIVPEITLDYPNISPDGTRLAGATRNRKIAVIAVNGGAPEILPVENTAIPIKWSADGTRILIRAEDPDGGTWLEWVDLKSGKIKAWKKLKPPEGELASVGIARVSRDEKTFVYAYQRRSSELFVVDGWK